MRQHCIFHVVPMYNPDGVEMEYPRENANGVDIESNWGSSSPEVEVMHLKNRFLELMYDDIPIEIALNLHASYDCTRYFVYHHQNGTSQLYTDLEKDFIGGVRSHFYSGFEPWNFFISWSGGTPTQYPESWWWMNHQENIMALTYEDMNCSEAGFYDKTAYSILHGISDYLELGYLGIMESNKTENFELRAFPNPFSDLMIIEWNSFKKAHFAIITDLMGKEIIKFQAEDTIGGRMLWDGKNQSGIEVSNGVYILNLFFCGQKKSVKISKY